MAVRFVCMPRNGSFSFSRRVGTMVNCSDFLRGYSDFRDGLLDPAGSAALEQHLATCASCARYDRILGRGVGELRAVPGIEPSYDFLPRLQHRLYHLEEERAWWKRHDASGASLGFVLLLALAIGVTAWLPVAQPKQLVVELPPVSAVAPQRAETVHALFRAGPHLTPRERASAFAQPAANTVFFHYTPLGSYATFSSRTLGPR